VGRGGRPSRKATGVNPSSAVVGNARKKVAKKTWGERAFWGKTNVLNAHLLSSRKMGR